MGMTKDEHYVLALFSAARESGDDETPFNRYEIGQRAGLHPRGVDAICKLLIQANFVRKGGEDEVRLTPHGIQLAERLDSEKHGKG